jgi:hypothetical protein
VNVDGLRFAEVCSAAMENGMCERAPCPLCSSILLSIAKSSGELIAIQNFDLDGSRVEITARWIGGIEKWM